MARQRLNEKKTNRIRKETGLPIIKVLVRGGSDHMKLLCLENGKITYMDKRGETFESDDRWQ